MKNIHDVVNSGLCLGCGICTYSDKVGEMTFSKNRFQKIPVLTNENRGDKVAFEICPGKGYDIIGESGNLYGKSNYDLELGHIYNQYAVCSNDREIVKNASSGGIMTHAAIYLLEQKHVDRVLTTYFEFDNGVSTKCILAKSRGEILQSQGSKYCPVDLSEAIQEIKLNNYKVAVIGTPCQIAGIRKIQRMDEDFSRKVIITIGNFCGGIKNFKNINLIARRKGINPKNITSFRFRGNGQPGSMLIKETTGKTIEIPYPAYVGLNGLSKHLRCHLCVDATAELADLACGDAWVPRFLNDVKPWSVLITRSKIADDLIREMNESELITTRSISTEEIKSSQHENLTSKKTRQRSRFLLYKTLGFRIPSFDGGYFENKVNILTEIKVFTKHRIRYMLELLHLFNFTYKLRRFMKAPK